MATFLFNDIIFGPIKSRRLGVSLGVNLLPIDNKICNFNCIYCECGWNQKSSSIKFPSKDIVLKMMETRLVQMSNTGELPDVITFAGNGEPTIHPDFPSIIEGTLLLRDKFCPQAQVAVLTNATMLHSTAVLNALLSIDRAILKMDSAVENTRAKINLPAKHIPLDTLVQQFSLFGSKLVIQTLFLRATFDGVEIDNTTKDELDALLNIYKRLNPSEVMIYCIDRDTPLQSVYKITSERMDEISRLISSYGIKVSVSY